MISGFVHVFGNAVYLALAPPFCQGPKGDWEGTVEPAEADSTTAENQLNDELAKKRPLGSLSAKPNMYPGISSLFGFSH